ncbi:MAG: glycerol-3-phosphate 1-O-acyltransferase PlsY [Marinomonas sp.]
MTLFGLFQTSPLILLLVGVAAYLLGSVSFGLIISKLFGLADPRSIGSGNIGATNVLRSGSKPAALLTVLLDGAKGGVAVLIARALFADDAAQVAGLCAFLGHLFPVWLKFKGGKGVATFFGTLLALAWPLGLIALAIWLVTFLAFRYSSLAALVAACILPPFAMVTGYLSISMVVLIMCGLVIYKHRENMERLKAGTESKFTRKK